ncbi:MAG: TolC family protein [Phycisphaeraceae bacterium]
MRNRPAFAASLLTPLVLFVIGCQSYNPIKPDLQAHHAIWLARDPNSAAVKPYLQELGKAHGSIGRLYAPQLGLTLRDAEVVALVFNPHLRVARLKASIPIMGAKEAGRWDDPELDFELLRFVQNMDKPWVLAGSIAFTIPISGRLAIEKDKAIAEGDVEIRRANHEEADTLKELRLAWLEWSAALERITLEEQYLKRVDEAVRISGQQRKFGKISITAERAIRIEQAARQGELSSLRADATRQELSIKALLGLAPQAQITLVPSLSISPGAAASGDTSAVLQHPRLLLAAAAYEVAEQALRLAVRKQFPDLKLGPASEWDEGNWKAGLTLSVPIPVFNGNRREIAEARAARDAAMASLEGEYETLLHAAAQARAQADGAQLRRAHIETVVAPLVDQQITDLNKQAELGELDVLLTLDALTRSHEAKLSGLEAHLSEAKAASVLRSLIQPPPRTPVLKNLSNKEPLR